MLIKRIDSVARTAYEAVARHPIATLVIVSVLLYLLLFSVPGFILGIKESFSDKKIEQTKEQAASEKTAGDQERMQAGESEISRKAEDLNREQNLNPQRQATATRFAEARRQRQALETSYEKNRQNPRAAPPDNVDLRRRNCADLAKALPGQPVAGCQ